MVSEDEVRNNTIKGLETVAGMQNQFYDEKKRQAT